MEDIYNYFLLHKLEGSGMVEGNRGQKKGYLQGETQILELNNDMLNSLKNCTVPRNFSCANPTRTWLVFYKHKIGWIHNLRIYYL